MKKAMNKLIPLILASLLAVISVISANAKSYIVDTDGAKYEMLADDTVIFAGYEGDYGKVVVPGYFQTKPVIKVENMALKNNTVVTEIDFSYAENLEKIGLYAFSGCENLSFVDVPASISSVGISVFRDCISLYRASFLGNGTKVPNEAFLNCYSLEIAELSPDLTAIGDYAFANCTSLEYLELPATVTSIGNNAFLNDDNLTLGVYYDSYAYHYAIENNIEYKLLDGVKLGDVNGDGIVNVDDATLIQKYLAELETIEGIYLYAADSNEDTEIDVSDATAIQMYSVELQTGHPIGQVLTK